MRVPQFLEPLFEDPASIATTVGVGIGALLLIRLIRLAATGGESPAAPGPSQALTVSAPIAEPLTPARRSWFPTATERMAEEAEVIRAETELTRSEADRFMARIDKARAEGGLVQATAELQQILAAHAPKKSSRQRAEPKPAPARALTLREIQQVLRALPASELPPDLREALHQLFAAHLKEKGGGSS